MQMAMAKVARAVKAVSVERVAAAMVARAVDEMVARAEDVSDDQGRDCGAVACRQEVVRERWENQSCGQA